MSEYAKLRLQCEHSAFSDYGSSSVHNILDEITPSMSMVKHRVPCATGGTTIFTTQFTTVSYLVVFNTDSTNFVTLGWTDAAADGNTIVLAAGEFTVIPDVDGSTSPTITADTAACDCEVTIFGT